MSSIPPPFTRVGVSLVIFDKEGRVLTGTRMGSHGANTLQLPGGHIEKYETTYSCARRETKEETNLDILVEVLPFTSTLRTPSDPLPAPPALSVISGTTPPEYYPIEIAEDTVPWEAHVRAVTNDSFRGDEKHYVTLFVRGMRREERAVPVVMEPGKCTGWVFRSWREIRGYERAREGRLFEPLRRLLTMYPDDHEIFKKPEGVLMK